VKKECKGLGGRGKKRKTKAKGKLLRYGWVMGGGERGAEGTGDWFWKVQGKKGREEKGELEGKSKKIKVEILWVNWHTGRERNTTTEGEGEGRWQTTIEDGAWGYGKTKGR